MSTRFQVGDIFPAVPTNAFTFDAYNQSGGNMIDGAIFSQDNAHIIFTGTCDNDIFYRDLAEDADIIVMAAFGQFIKHNGKSIPNAGLEGVGVGTLAYFTWKYMKDRGIMNGTEEHTKIAAFGGPLTTNPEDKFIDAATVRTYAQVVDFGDTQFNASVWTTTLKEIYTALTINNVLEGEGRISFCREKVIT